MSVKNAINWRKAIKSYINKLISEEDLNAIHWNKKISTKCLWYWTC